MLEDPLPAALSPCNEDARLLALSDQGVMDTAPEPGFDRVVRLACAAFGGGLSAAVTFLDAERQWMKSQLNVAVAETRRDNAFCSHAILQRDVLWVEDARADERFCDLRTVAGPPFVRFYAGAPVFGRDELPLGALCVFGSEPRAFDAALAAQLADLAAVVTSELELRRGKAALKANLQARADAEALNEVLVRQAPVALAMFDREMRYLRVSPRWEADYRMCAAELIGRNHYERLPDARRYAHLHRAALAGEPQAGEASITRTDGTTRHSRFEMTPWYDGAGRIGGVILTSADVSDLADAREAAEAASRAKSEFLANMSHELRTPLNGVMGVTSALARTPLSDRQLEMVSLIESSATALERLLTDVLDLARVESGRLELSPEPFDMADLVHGAATLFQWRARDKGVAFGCEVAPGAQGRFLADPVRLRQVLTNLISNAVKFTTSGHVQVRADADARGWIVFEVEDTGIGFDEETYARLFERFQQADGSITRRFGGTGLGLSIARSLARLMGGELDATSEPGRGATFRLVLPLERVERRAAPRPPSQKRPVGPRDRALRVLLAEDHEVNRAVVQLILQAAGAELVSVTNGREALDAYRDGAFDLVLMDMQMPVMDGLTALKAMREWEAATGASRTPVVSLTANALPEHVRASAEAGADAHLCKPITAQALLDVVERLSAPGAPTACAPAFAAPVRGAAQA